MPSLILLLPILGEIIFILLFLVAAYYYPGGSSSYPEAQTYSFIHNYWCDLLSPTNYYGVSSPGYKFAIAANIQLCISLLVFWWYLPDLFPNATTISKNLIKFCGIISMISLLFLFTDAHNNVINLSAITGGIALSFCIYELSAQGNSLFIYGALFCLLLCTINFIIYQTYWGIEFLPLLQKVAFVFCFLWIAGLSWANYTVNR